MERDLSVGRAAVNATRTRILLAPAYSVRECVVSGDVIHRRSRLRVPIAPRHAAVGRDDSALVGDGEDDVGVVRIDPDALVIIAAR